MKLNPFIAIWIRTWLQNNAPWIIALRYGDFWNYRNNLCKRHRNIAPRLYTAFLDRFNSFIGINASIESPPVLPHGLFGIFISNSAKVGRNVIIYQHVTIGSNTVKGSKGYGAPTIEDNVLIGAGVKIIGNITVGKNSRIGAGCIVTQTIPPNSVVVMTQPRIIKKELLENQYISNKDGNLFQTSSNH